MNNNQDVNLIIDDFKKSMVATINNSGLPISIVYYICKDIMNDITMNYDAYLEKARAQLAASMPAPAPADNEPEIVEEEDSES